ncbi:MAG: hypothetical protein OEW21_16680, partial [Betaproteobacteria bacterium]|nr:hypothetical protein [Betaproteobacteria bacterium]
MIAYAGRRFLGSAIGLHHVLGLMTPNPYAPPVAAVSDPWAAPGLSARVQGLRGLAMIGNVLLMLLPVFYFLSGRRPDLAGSSIAVYCLILSACSAVALFSRAKGRACFFGAIVLNALVVLLLFYLAATRNIGGNFLAMFLLTVPAPLNLAAVM